MASILSPVTLGGKRTVNGDRPPGKWRFNGRLVLAIIVAAGVLAALAAQLVSANAENTAAVAPAGAPAAPVGWTTAFSDDFNGAGGTGIGSQWKYDTGSGGSFGTQEIETMTNSTSNVALDGNGNLNITALNNNGAWTSGRVQTSTPEVGAPAGGELVVTASLQQPNAGAGYWPAFWMVGPGQWPTTGEVDILEDVNSLSETAAALHCGTSPGGPCNEGNGLSSGLQPCPGCQDGYHTYTMLLNRADPANESMSFYLDGNQYFTVTEGQVGAGPWQAAYDHNMSIVLDLAIGGAYPDGVCHCTAPDGTTVSGGVMSVAYVAAYTTTTGTAGTALPPSNPNPGATPSTPASSAPASSAPASTAPASSAPASSPPASSAPASSSPAISVPTASPLSTVPLSPLSSPVGPVASPDNGTPGTPAASGASGTGQIVGVNGMCMESRGGGTANFTPVEVADCNNANDQQFSVDTSNNTVRILGKCLDVNGGTTHNGTSMDVYACNNQPAQVLIPRSDGTLYNPHSGKCVDDLNSNIAGTQLQIDDCNGSAGQRWTFPPNTPQVGTVYNSTNALCAAVRGGGTANFTAVQVASCDGSNAQVWTIVGNTIHALGKCLDVNGGGTANGTPVDLYDCNNQPAQVFTARSDGTLYNPNSGKCLDDPNSSGPGTQLQVDACTGSAGERWVLP